ncbi:hypothetical protein EDC04DRAFT_3090980 [Pisolithus marmoratus]|nr:hypothetical protein EDC04DRAFT_3090980 [Pisolithus marmoratus]
MFLAPPPLLLVSLTLTVTLMRFTASQITSVSLHVGSTPHVLEIGSPIEYCTVATWKEYLGHLADTSPHSSALISLLASTCCRHLADTFGRPLTLIFPHVSTCLRYLVDTFIRSTANGKCKWQPPHCLQCCKLAGGCGLPGYQPKGALPLPSPSPVMPLSTLIPSASHTGPTTCSYACPLDENYAWAYYEAHAKTFEVEQLLKQSAQVQSDLQSIVHVVMWVRAQEAPRHICVVNATPGTFVPAAHQIITDLLTADKVSVYCQDLWFEQLLTAPLVVPKTDATVFLCDASLAVSDIIGLDVELSRSGSGKKMFPWKYVCDLYPGMTMLSVLGTAEEIEKKFPLAFPNTDFVLSTFYKHRKPFMDASTLRLVESRVALGHTEGGKWALLKADVERFMKEGSLNMGSSVNTLSLPSTFNPSLLPQDSNQQDASYSLNTETTVAPELLGEIGNDMDMAFSFTDFDLSFVLNDLQSDNTLLLNLEESQYNSVFDDLLQDNAS